MTPWLSDALLRAQTDERLVGLARAGHERAFVAIVERYRRPLLAFARRIAPEGRAEDVVQQALTSAWAALAAGAEIAHLRGWLHQIVRHEALRVAQREGRDVHDPLDPGGVVGVRALDAELEDRLRVREAFAGIAGLPAQQREALVRTAVEGRSRSEVAASLGLSEGAVRQLVHRARTTLRTAVTAITPLPLASWAAAAAGGGGNGALVEAGGATIAGTLVKAGTVVLATGALATGVTLSGHDRRPQHGAAASRPTAHAALPVAAMVPGAPQLAADERRHEGTQGRSSHGRSPADRHRGGRHEDTPSSAHEPDRVERHDGGGVDRHDGSQPSAPTTGSGGGERHSSGSSSGESTSDGGSPEAGSTTSGLEDPPTITTTRGSDEASGSGSSDGGSGSSGGDALTTTTSGTDASGAPGGDG